MLEQIIQALMGGTAQPQLPPQMLDPFAPGAGGGPESIPYPMQSPSVAQSPAQTQRAPTPRPDTFGQGAPPPFEGAGWDPMSMLGAQGPQPQGMGATEVIDKSMQMPGMMPQTQPSINTQARRLMARAPQQVSAQRAPQQGGGLLGGLFGGGDNEGPGFGQTMGRLGPALMLMSGDPNYIKAGTAMLGQQAKAATTSKEKQAEKRKLTQTFQFLRSKGIGEQEALAMVNNPELFKGWVKQQYAEPAKPTAGIQEYQFAKDQGYKGSFADFKRDTRAGTTVNVGGEKQTAGWKKIDQTFADDYVKWKGGGFADTQKQITQIRESNRLLDESIKSGKPITGAIGLLPQSLQPFVNEKGVIAREAVEEVVQRSLKEILGAQFTEKEGERLIARAFNPLLPPEENRRRVQRLLESVESAAQAKQAMVDYFDKNGTLQGYQGPRPNMPSADSIGPAAQESKSTGQGSRRYVNPQTGQIIEWDGQQWRQVQ